jgi:hypothetical protein
MPRRFIVRAALSSIVPLLLTLLPVAAFAQGGTLTYRPFQAQAQATSVPTLGTLALVVTAILLAVVAMKLLRSKQGSHMVIALFGASLLLFVAGNVRLLDIAHAIAFEMTNPNGGVIEGIACYGEPVTNVSGVAQQITAINCPAVNDGTAGASQSPVTGTFNLGAPPCNVGLVLADGEQCQLTGGRPQ